MDTRHMIGAFLGHQPISLFDVLNGDVYPMDELRAISGHPDYYGYADRGVSVTDRDVVVKKDIRLKTRILLDSTFPENADDFTQWFLPTVIYRGLPVFSITTRIAPSEVLDRCTAASDVPALGMRTYSREYTGQMYGGSIDITPEAIQRSSNDQLRYMFNLKERQMTTSMRMTMLHVVYGRLMAGPSIEFVQMHNMADDRLNRHKMFHRSWQTRIDNFLLFNLRRTNTLAVFVDLDNSLRYSASSAGTPADTILVHPTLADQLPLKDAAVAPARQVYFKCATTDKKELDESDIETLSGAEFYAPAPNKAMLVNGVERFVMTVPYACIDGGDRHNLSELDATFKSYNVVGYNPLRRGRSRLLDFDSTTDVPWNEIKVTDLDTMSDGTIRIEEIMKKSGYLDTETYSVSRYQRMFADTPSLNRLMTQMNCGEFDGDCLAGQNLARKSCLLRPSRKVYYDPNEMKFRPAIAYGHSELPESPVDDGDIVSGMTMMARCLMSESSFSEHACGPQVPAHVSGSQVDVCNVPDACRYRT